MQRAAVFVAGLVGVCASANAQPGSLPATALEDFPHVQISNGLITAQVYPPGEKQLYSGTRFDHAGVVFHVTYKGQDFSTYWFDRFLTDPRETGKQPAGTETACCATSGPVEEFAAVGFEDAGMGGRFLKPGIGIFKRGGRQGTRLGICRSTSAHRERDNRRRAPHVSLLRDRSNRRCKSSAWSRPA